MKKKLLITFVFIGFSFVAQAQFQGNFVQFFNNETYLNPAFAGTQISAFNISTIARADYVGIASEKFAANKVLLTVDKRFDEKNFALALNFNKITFNSYNNYELAVNYSYHLNVGRDRKLCMGLKAGGIYADRFKTLSIREANDNTFSDSALSNNPTFLPKIGAGFVYKSEKLYAGISSPDVSNDKLNLTASGGYKYFITEDLYIEPNFLIRYYKSNASKFDINTLIGKHESFWLGANYSVNNSVALMGAIYVNGRIEIGYALDYNTNLTSGRMSHEIMLQWDIEDAL
jgi:type IX secretion system PorP/SprF family membrane protein